MKEKIHKEISSIYKIFLLAKKSFSYAWYMYKPRTESELKYIVSTEFLDFTRHVFWRISIIELCKLFSNNNSQKFNLIKFISKLKENGDFRSMDFDENIIDSWEIKFALHKDVVDRICKMRDKIYAHTDRIQPDQNDIEVSFEEVNQLIEFTEQIIKSVYSNVLNGLVDTRLRIRDKEFKIFKEWSDDFDNKIKSKFRK